MSVVLYEETEGVARITINRPDRRNAMDPHVTRGLLESLERAEADEHVRVAVLTGAGDRAFCAGGDLSTLPSAGGVEQHFARAEIGELLARMRTSRLPVVARVNGHALAGGFGLMLGCDLVVAVDDARLGLPEMNVGLWPFMVSAVVQRDLPRKLALDLMLTGRTLQAGEALQWGFVNRVVPRNDLDAATEDMVQALLSRSPLVTSLGKRSFYRAEDMAFADAVDYLAGMLTVTVQSEDTAEGVRAFFEKRPPRWKGR